MKGPSPTLPSDLAPPPPPSASLPSFSRRVHGGRPFPRVVPDSAADLDSHRGAAGRGGKGGERFTASTNQQFPGDFSPLLPLYKLETRKSHPWQKKDDDGRNGEGGSRPPKLRAFPPPPLLFKLPWDPILLFLLLPPSFLPGPLDEPKPWENRGSSGEGREKGEEADSSVDRKEEDARLLWRGEKESGGDVFLGTILFLGKINAADFSLTI